MKPPFAIGIDLGGTQVKAAAFDVATGRCLERTTLPTRDGEKTDGIPAFQAQVKSALDSLEHALGSGASAVGLSSPGLADADRSRIRFMPGRLDGLEGFAWREFLGRSELTVLNDAHAALLGEIWQGAARDETDVILLTIGTGVGGAVVCDGRLLRGHLGRAGHLGHLSVDFTGSPDICGTPGSIEDAIGNHSVAKRSANRFSHTRELLEAVVAGDPGAGEIWKTSVRALGAAIASLVNVTDPATVLIGGGIAEADDLLFVPLQEALDEFEWRPDNHKVNLRKASLGEWAGTYGAAFFALEGPDWSGSSP